MALPWRLVLPVLFFWCGSCFHDCEAQVCKAAAPTSSYYWPMARGPVGIHGVSPHAAPRNLSSSLAWHWAHPDGKFSSKSIGGVLIDDQKNLYAVFHDGIYKFSPDGVTLWHHVEYGITDVPALMDGALFSTQTSGSIFALRMDSGQEIWRSTVFGKGRGWTAKGEMHKRISVLMGVDIGSVGAFNGVVVAKAYGMDRGGDSRMMGLNSTNGEILWEYSAERSLLSFFPIFTNDGKSFIIQDSAGGVYRIKIDGELIWKNVHDEEGDLTQTHGGAMIGPNGLVYVMRSYGLLKEDSSGWSIPGGSMTAYRLVDGTFVWKSEEMPDTPNPSPVIGQFRKEGEFLVIATMGSPISVFLFQWYYLLGGFGEWINMFISPIYTLIRKFSDEWVFRNKIFRNEIWGLSADTGKTQWKWAHPVWKREANHGKRSLPCFPNRFSNPILDATGTLHIGTVNGKIYALANSNLDNVIEEVSQYDAEAAFNSGGAAIAPGMMGILSCDALFVFRE